MKAGLLNVSEKYEISLKFLSQKFNFVVFETWSQFSSKFSPKSLVNFGQFTKCINLNDSVIQGQHCMITYSPIIHHDFDHLSNQHGFEIEEEMVHFKAGICLPASCTLIQVENFTKHLLRESNFIAIRTFCQTNQPQMPQPLDHFVM